MYRYITFVLLLLFNVQVIKCDVILETKLGKVAGVKVSSVLENENFYSFMGIPYALPPIDDLRFMPPKPHTGWSDVLQADKERKPCAQFNHPIRQIKNVGFCGEEDCLYLSVHTPKLPAERNPKLPVMVFLYNELFRLTHNASKVYGPDFFMKEDVIVVYIQHRVGSLGFLSFEDDLLPGNNGLRDVIQALNWIQENIENFGGDSERVTLMGNQGGAVIADLLLQSPKAKGLFHNVILQSGTAFQPYMLGKNSRQSAFALSKLLERQATSSESLIERLSSISAMEISTREAETVGTDDARQTQKGVHPFSPVVEHDHPEAVVTEYPETAKLDIEIPVMIGYNSREGIDFCERLLRKPEYLTFADRDFLLTFPIRQDYRFDILSSHYEAAITEIKDFYFDESYIKVGKPGEYLGYIGDIFSFYPIDYAVRRYVNESKAPIYYYSFDYGGDLNMRKNAIIDDAMLIDGTWGATTTDELCYLFLCKPIKKKYKTVLNNQDSEEYKVLTTMVRLWTNFAKYGNPTPKDEEFVWKPATKENKECLVISDNPQMRNNLHEDKVRFWDDFMARYRELAIDGVVKDIKDEL